MERTQIHIPADHKAAAKAIAARRGLSLAALIRTWIAHEVELQAMKDQDFKGLSDVWGEIQTDLG